MLLALVLLSAPAAEAQLTVYTERGEEAEEWLWEELSKHSPSDVMTAAVLSYFWRESQYRSDAVAGWASSLAGYGIDLCATVTEKTDEGLEDGSSKDYFMRACQKYGGYGLGQWQSISKVEALYDYASEYGTSIGDAEMQCAFIFYHIETSYPRLWKRLCRCDDPEKAGRLIGVWYDGTRAGSDYIGVKAGMLWEKYHEEK